MSYWNNHKTEEQAMLGELIAIRQLLSIAFKKEIAEHEVEKAATLEKYYAKEKENKEKWLPFQKLFLEWAQETKTNNKAARINSVSNCLARAEIYSMENLNKYSDDDLLKIRNFGQKALEVTKAVKAWAEAREAKE
jgi:DNA-directed RNA polymerase alpha subunit